jgi:hypothetical protein
MRIGRAMLFLAAAGLTACRTTGEGPDPAAEAGGGLPETASLDWQMTEAGPCVATPPQVSFIETEACAPPATVPGFPFYAIPYMGTLLAAGNAVAVGEASDCVAGSTSAMLHNRQAAYLLAQQCMAPEDVSAMQEALYRLALLDRAETGALDAPTRAAMARWHREVYDGSMPFGPTKEFAARVVESAGGPAAVRGRTLR